MIKAIRAVERAYMRSQLKPFLLSNAQFSQIKPVQPVQNSATQAEPNTKQGGASNG